MFTAHRGYDVVERYEALPDLWGRQDRDQVRSGFNGRRDIGGEFLGTLKRTTDTGYFEFPRCQLPSGFAG